MIIQSHNIKKYVKKCVKWSKKRIKGDKNQKKGCLFRGSLFIINDCLRIKH